MNNIATRVDMAQHIRRSKGASTPILRVLDIEKDTIRQTVSIFLRYSDSARVWAGRTRNRRFRAIDLPDIEGEFTARVVGFCSLTVIFLGHRGHMLRGWSVLDVMSTT